VDFIKSLFLGEFNFIIPISYIIAGTLVAIFVFTVRYLLYTKRKKAFAKEISNSQKRSLQENKKLANEEDGQAVQEKRI
jgi:Ca2+-dependent lipid-binding protein